jgi:hypothetical protein
MKKFFLFAIILLAYSTLLSEEEYYYHRLSYEDFVPWMQSVVIPDFELQNTNKEGSEEVYNIEYSAMFKNKNREMINVRIGHPNLFNSFDEMKKYNIVGPYELNGFEAVYIYSPQLTKPSNISYFMVKMKNLQATFSIIALTKDIFKLDEFEEIFPCFNLYAIENTNIAKWPDEIPIPFRLPGAMETIIKQESQDPMVKSQYLVKIKKSTDFLRNLRKFYNDKKGWLDLTTYQDIILICNTANDFIELDKLSDQEIIEFTYYVK